MSEVPERRMRLRWVGVDMAGLLPSRRAGTVNDSADLRVPATDDGVGLLPRSTAIARSVCIASGLDAELAEGRLVAEGRRHVVNDLRIASGIPGCQMQPRSLIICQEGAAGCVSGEGRRAQNSHGRES